MREVGKNLATLAATYINVTYFPDLKGKMGLAEMDAILTPEKLSELRDEGLAWADNLINESRSIMDDADYSLGEEEIIAGAILKGIKQKKDNIKAGIPDNFEINVDLDEAFKDRRNNK